MPTHATTLLDRHHERRRVGAVPVASLLVGESAAMLAAADDWAAARELAVLRLSLAATAPADLLAALWPRYDWPALALRRLRALAGHAAAPEPLAPTAADIQPLLDLTQTTDADAHTDELRFARAVIPAGPAAANRPVGEVPRTWSDDPLAALSAMTRWLADAPAVVLHLARPGDEPADLSSVAAEVMACCQAIGRWPMIVVCTPRQFAMLQAIPSSRQRSFLLAGAIHLSDPTSAGVVPPDHEPVNAGPPGNASPADAFSHEAPSADAPSIDASVDDALDRAVFRFSRRPAPPALRRLYARAQTLLRRAAAGADATDQATGNADSTADVSPNDLARSAAERLLFDLLNLHPATAGRFELNAAMPFAFGHRPAEIDLLCQSLRLAVEVDGYHHFADADAYRRDRRKDLLLQQQRYTVLRVLAADVVERMEEVLDGIVSAVDHAAGHTKRGGH